MNCEEIRNLALLADCGEATAAEAAAVRAHAAGCRACADEMRAVREGLELLRHAPTELPSRSAREALGGLLLREAPRRAAPGRGWRLAAASVAAAAVLGIVLWKAIPSRAPAPVTTGGQVGSRPEAEPEPRKTPVPPTTPAVPETDPAVAWDDDGDVDGLRESLASLRPARTSTTAAPSSDDLWFSASSATSFDTLYDELDDLSASGSDRF